MVALGLGTDNNSGEVVGMPLSEPEEVLGIERKKRSGRRLSWGLGCCVHQRRVASVSKPSEFTTFSLALLIETKNGQISSWSQISWQVIKEMENAGQKKVIKDGNLNIGPH